MYKKNRYLNTDIHLYEQTNEKVQLLQSDKRYPLSEFYLEGKEVKALINCSYFSPDYVLGRNQGDLYNNTYNSSEDNKWCDVVFFNDNSFIAGKFSSGDYRNNVSAGFSPAVLKVNGKLMYSDLISNAHSRMTTRSQQTAIAITNENKLILFVSEGRNVSDFGLTGAQVFEYLESHYNTKVVALLDGGGSSEMIVDKKIMNFLNGGERPMFNGLALISDKTNIETDMTHVMFPCCDGWDSQGYHEKHKAIDIGWLISKSTNGQTPILACQDGVVEYADYYSEWFGGKEYKPIVCIIRHETLNNTWYSAYWHLASTPKNKGDIVKMGDEIGIRGNTGYSAGTHLHFVLMKCPKGISVPKSHEFDKYAVNPIDYIEVYENQVFESRGNYTLKHHSDIDNLKKELEEAKKQISVTTSELVKANKKIQEKEIELIKVENEYSRVVQTLEQIKKIIEGN